MLIRDHHSISMGGSANLSQYQWLPGEWFNQKCGNGWIPRISSDGTYPATEGQHGIHSQDPF